MAKKMSLEDKKHRGTHSTSRDLMPLSQNSDIPDPPDYIADIPLCVSLYNAICTYLKQYETFGDIDYAIVASASWWAYLYYENVEAVKEHGAVQVTKTGYQQTSGYFTVMKEASSKMLVLFKELGLTPKQREGIRSFMDRKPDAAGEKDVFAALVGDE